MMFNFAGVDSSNPVRAGVDGRMDHANKMTDDRLGESKWLAGNEFSLADVMSAWNFSGLRQFSPYALTKYPNIVRWLKAIGEREAYQRAMEKGDPGFEPLLGEGKPEMIKRG